MQEQMFLFRLVDEKMIERLHFATLGELMDIDIEPQ